MPEQLRLLYNQRHALLELLASSLKRETKDALQGVPHIDRITYRAKGENSFIEKATDPANDPPYQRPLVEIEDQVAGRIILFFLSDIPVVRERLRGTFNTVEWSARRPRRDEEFGYESEHLICLIPPQVKPAGWDELEDRPATFEIQLRTIFMHAYAEPQHDIAYKAASELSTRTRRELAWIAASAWGADQAYLRVVRDTEGPDEATATDPNGKPPNPRTQPTGA